ncbi:hypothetical protein [Streptomyces sp. SGAir0957]
MRRLARALLTVFLPGTGRRRAHAPPPEPVEPAPLVRPRSPYAREAAEAARVDVSHVPLVRPYYRAERMAAAVRAAS